MGFTIWSTRTHSLTAGTAGARCVRRPICRQLRPSSARHRGWLEPRCREGGAPRKRRKLDEKGKKAELQTRLRDAIIDEEGG